MRKTIQILALVLCVGLLAGMAVMIAAYRREAEARTRRLAALSAEARPYEQELAQLKREQEMEELRLYAPEGPGAAVVAFRIGGEEDLSAALEQGAAYGFTPSILVNVDDEDAEGVLQALQGSGLDVILSCAVFKETTADRIRAVQELLTEADCRDTHGFLLKTRSDTPENRETLKTLGVTSLFVFGEGLASEVEGDMVVMNYSYVNKNSYDPSSRLAALENSEQALLFVLDLKDTTATEQQINDVLEILQEQDSRGSIAIRSVAAARRTVQDRVNAENERVEAFRTAQEERGARIEELEGRIREIYSHWDG